MTHRKFWLVLFVLLGGFAWAGDIFLGWISDTNEIRIAARQFREEAAYLELSTKNLIPNTEHIYRDWDSSQSADQRPSAKIRRFQTDPNGLVVDSPDENFHKVTILFLGGSTTECNEVAEESRFPTVVQRRLREAGFDVATANAGVRGHTTQDSINALLNRAGFRQADIIVMMENINDRLRLGTQGNYDARLGKDSPTSTKALLGAVRGFQETLWDFMAYRSNTLFLLRYWSNQSAAWREETRAVEVTERSIDLFENEVLQNRDKFKQNVELFVNIVRTLGKRPVLMTQPLGLHSNGQDVFNNIIREVAQRDEVTLIDLDNAIGEIRDSAFLFDKIHLNNRGSKFVGGVIASSLAPLVN
jgi:lysophospholipase L1-like esterase